MLRRQMLAAALVLAAAPAFGQVYPTKPITMIVPFAAGGPTDLLARIIGERMGKELGQQFIIENVTGAAGTIAMAKLARAAPDGYTIGIGHVGTNVANAVIYTKLGFDLVADLEPIARLPANPMLVVSTNNVPAKTLKELVEYLKANPDKVSGGTAGIGSGSHLGALAFNKATGATYQLVPYRGTGPAMQDLISGQIQVMVDQSSNSLPRSRPARSAPMPRPRPSARPPWPISRRQPRPAIRWRSRSGTACGRPRARPRTSSTS
jgi:tripartite-type tricarboxylate transporter receptor subunit TctC